MSRISHRWWLAALFGVAVCRLWLMELPSSLWVDETGTAFVVQHPHHPSLAVAPQVPASIYYWLPRLAVKLGGTSEAVYRIPSLLAMLAAIWLLARLAARLVHPHAAWFAAFACLALKGIDYYALDARPYALGILIGAASVWLLVRWLDWGGVWYAAGFAVCAALLWRVHLVYWPFYPVLGAYAVLRVARRQTRVSWAQLAAVFAVIGISLLPVAVQALAIRREAAAHVIAGPPSWRDFLHLVRWNLVLIAAAGALVVRRFTRMGITDRPGDRATSAALIFMWWLAPPFVLFVLSVASGESVFLARYISLALPGAALAATWVAGQFLPVQKWATATLLMGVGAMAWHGQWTSVWPSHEKSNWRAAAAEVNRIEAQRAAPVICPSPYIEARDGVWRPDYRLPGFLYTHLAYYPVHGPLILFPFAEPPDAFAYAREILPERVLPAGSFVIYGGSESTRFWQHWFAARPELRRWKNHRDEYGDVYVVHFER